MFNAIYLATLGNPRAIINIIEILLTHPMSRDRNRVRVICPNQFISILSGRKIQIYGGEVSILHEKDLYRLYVKLEQKCESLRVDKDKCMALINLLISSPSPISEREIRRELNIDDEHFSYYLSIIRDSFNELWNIEPFMFFKMVLPKDAEEIYSKAEAPGAESNLLKILNAFEFYEFSADMQSFEGRIFIPYKRLSFMEFEDRDMYRNFVDFIVQTVPELRSEDQIRILVDTELFDKVRKTNERYVMLSPAALNIFYPSPSIFFLDFIDELDKRFEIGMEAMRNLAEYESEFHAGVLRLLREGSIGKNIEVEGPNFERYGPRDIEVIEVSSTEITGKYKVRAYVMSLLRISEMKFQRKLERVIDEMRVAGIPLLLIFSWNPLPNEIIGILETYFG